jgi:hypothetical protein
MSNETTIITSRKVVIGNPVNMPLIDGKETPSVFRVAAGATLLATRYRHSPSSRAYFCPSSAGGWLQLSFVRMYRGGGQLIATIPVLRGGAVIIDLGGSGPRRRCTPQGAGSSRTVWCV